MRTLISALAFALVAVTAPAQAAQLTYTATLAGHQEPTNTGSAATGTATIHVDTETQRVDAQITIHGLKFDDLAHHLAHAPLGPIHLHRYQGNDVSLILPFPMGPSYAETADGFTVNVAGYAYSAGAAVLHSDLSFDAFLTALASDPIYINVHTNRFGDGEISGRLAPAS